MAENVHPHPGLILKCRIRHLQIPFFDLASRIRYDEDKLKEVLDLKIPMTVGICEKLSRFFGDDLDYWIKLQVNYELSLVAFETSYPKRHKDDPMSLPLPDRFG